MKIVVLLATLSAVFISGCGKTPSSTNSVTVEQYHAFQWVSGPNDTLLVVGFDQYNEDTNEDGAADYAGFNPGVYILNPDRTIRSLSLPRINGRSSNFLFVDAPVFPSHGKRAYAILTCNDRADGTGNRIRDETLPTTTYALTMWTLPEGRPKILCWMEGNLTRFVNQPAASDLPYVREFKKLKDSSRPQAIKPYDAHSFQIMGQTWER